MVSGLKSLLMVLGASIALTGAVQGAWAGSRDERPLFHHHRGHDRQVAERREHRLERRLARQLERRLERQIAQATDRLPSINVLPGIGTYSGSITVYHVPGMGTSTWLEGTRTNVVYREPVEMKLIKVDANTENSACSMEQGVCVIRP